MVAKVKKGEPENVAMPEGKPMQSSSLLGYSVMVEFTLKDGKKDEKIKCGFYDPKNDNWKVWASNERYPDKKVEKWAYIEQQKDIVENGQ